MTHFMKLNHEPFEKIRSGKKTIEMRLYDEKRRLINNGDIIIFTDVETKAELKCEVINMYIYEDFLKLYNQHDKVSIGYAEDEKADSDDMYAYYDKEKIQKYGVVGIELKIVM